MAPPAGSGSGQCLGRVAMNFRAVSPEAPCKICGAVAGLHGVVDFNKSCEIERGRFFQLVGIPVWYHRCPNCGFLFTCQFDDWTAEDWREHVYNADYAQFDPDGVSSRPEGNAASIADFAREIEPERILDYGGGSGILASRLREAAFDATSWDLNYEGARPDGDFDLICSFETFEHTTDPRGMLGDIVSFLRPGGYIAFSTWMLNELPAQDCSHWYIAPRNGHVSIHTRRSLELLFGDRWSLKSVSNGYHLARKIT